MSGTLRLSILIEAIDRASRPMAALQARLAGVAGGIMAVRQATQRLAAVSGVTVLAGAFGNLAGRARDAAGAIGGAAGRLALLAGGGAFAFNRLFVRPAAEFQNFGITLETVMGSVEAAQRRLAELSQFASQTPFSVNEVVAAGVQLQVLGIRGAAADRALRAAGDAASVFPGARLAETIGALGAAMRGEMDPLERFGVQAQTVGNDIVLRWERNGRLIEERVNKTNRRAIAASIARAWGDVAPNGMARRAGSWDGMLSNMGDAWENFRRRIGEAGPFQWLQDQLRDLLALISRLEADGTLARWAQETGAAITRAFQAMRDFAVGTETTEGVLPRLQRAFQAVWRVVGPVVDRIGGLETALILIGAVILGPVITALAALTSAMMVFGAALLLTPAGWFLAAVAAIAAAAYLIYENWEDVAAFFERIWAGIRRAWNSEQVVWLRETVAGAFELAASAVRAAWEPIESFFSALWSGISGAFSAGWAVIEPIVNAVIRGAEALGSILPRGAGRADGASGPVAAGTLGRFARRGSLEGFYGPAALGGEGGLPPSSPVRLDAGLDVTIRLPDGLSATVTPRGGDMDVRADVRRGTLAVPVP